MQIEEKLMDAAKQQIQESSVDTAEDSTTQYTELRNLIDNCSHLMSTAHLASQKIDELGIEIPKNDLDDMRYFFNLVRKSMEKHF